MRGFFLGALVLVGLDLLLTSTGAGVAGAAALPAQWLAKWMSPAIPLITAPLPVSQAGASTSGTASSSGNGLVNDIGTVNGVVTDLNPGMKIGSVIASKITGK